jgi:hypothetical protein
MTWRLSVQIDTRYIGSLQGAKMKVFISWSGGLSLQVAEELRQWLPLMIQAIRPYVSSEDTHKGTRWNEVVARELEDSNYGILCITSDNFSKSWLNFEAGALSKSLNNAFVSPFLVNIKASDITGPLTQFQATNFTYADVRRLIESINLAAGEPLGEAQLTRGFNLLWPTLQGAINKAVQEHSAKPSNSKPTRSAEEMLSELVLLTRQQQKALSEFVDTMSSPKIRPRVVRGVDFDEVGYNLTRLREAANSAVILGAPETPALVQLRGLVGLLSDALSPALDDRFNHLRRTVAVRNNNSMNDGASN